MALTLALTWLTLLGLLDTQVLPPDWQAAVSPWCCGSVIAAALAFLDVFHDLPPACLPTPPPS